MTKEQAVILIAQAAVESERRTGLPAEITAAQCALESGWLKSAPGNNCFGIKYSPVRHNGKQLLTTREYFDTADHATAWMARLAGREIIEAMPHSANGKRQYKVRDWFAAYPALADCFADHARLITMGKPYRKAWEEYLVHRDWRRLLAGIGPVYATAPDYATRVLVVLEGELQRGIDAVRNAPPAAA
jgi:flagellum-specific peptidoglycan hydrolase FlgJ